MGADARTPGQFQLAHTKGSSFVSVGARGRKAATNLNIRWNKHTYVFELIESDTPVLAFEFGMWISAEFKIYLIKEFQRLKDDENRRLASPGISRRT